jgi:ADP-ribosylglycohydrolase
MIECHKKNVDFTESLTNVLTKGGDCDSNCAIVMALVGAIIGYNEIPNFFQNKIINANVLNSPRPRS